MPKVTLSSYPVSALFGVAKPSGPTSMNIITEIQDLVARSKLFVEPQKLKKLQSDVAEGKKIRGRRLRELVKVGQGGTLDPLADGVLVVGVGKGTKKLSQFLECTKEYKTTCLLGCETDSYDVTGSIVRRASWKHITPEDVKSKLSEFTGTFQQTPPIFSALKMDGRPLYEYARQGIPLPRPIESREVVVHKLEMTEWLGADHQFRWPTKEFSPEEKKKLANATHEEGRQAESGSDASPSFTLDADNITNDQRGAAFVLRMTVSGGTYVRSIVHDLAHSLGSAGHVVTLTRTRQGKYTLDSGSAEDGDIECIDWDVFRRASGTGPSDDATGDAESEWTEWEQEVIKRMEVVS